SAVEEAPGQDELVFQQSRRQQHHPDQLITVEQHILDRTELPAGAAQHHILAAVDLELARGLLSHLLEPVRDLGSLAEHAGLVLELLAEGLTALFAELDV